MTTPVTPTLEAVIAALGAFITSLITAPVIRGNVNGVPMPKGGFVMMTEILQARLSTNITQYNDPGIGVGAKAVMQPTQFDFQIDCYGPLSADWAKTLVIMFNDGYAMDVMGGQVVPLYADDARNMPLVNGEQQYEQRWLFTAKMQYNPVVSVPQQFADVIEITIPPPLQGVVDSGFIPVDIVYPL